jgi:hypothetical protein
MTIHQEVANAREALLREAIAELQIEKLALARHNANLVKVLAMLAKAKDVPGVTVAEIAEQAQRAVDIARSKEVKPCQS